MKFTARIKRTSHIWANWRGSRRVQGEVSGVVFRLAPGLDYVSGDLTAGDVHALRHHPAVLLETTGIAVEPPIAVADSPYLARQEIPQAEIVRPPQQHPNRFTHGNQMNRYGQGKRR